MSVLQQDNLGAQKKKPSKEDELLEAMADILFDKWMAEKPKPAARENDENKN